ncbi:cytochrome b562 [Acinetobacter stercoris]|uniref:Soluble cytochrome b562 n=1 Tax=Acinetobacter stercoris TaxID=2126983 RepID=A0A2U3MWR0_9GAMM|nr:cytochrome b562 [Acinetobacter stercoris]SPL69793.1 Soluble cytochrome b562 precursor [Acinetobacter stercoris]
MIQKSLLSIIGLGMLGLSHFTIAAPLEQNMVNIATSYKAFNDARTAVDANKALDQIRLAALDSKKSTPMKLIGKSDNSPEVKGYKSGLEQLVVQVDKTKTLVDAGKLDQAKLEGKKLLLIRDQNHKLYK